MDALEILPGTCDPAGAADVEDPMVLSGAPYCQICCNLVDGCPAVSRTVEATFKITVTLAAGDEFDGAARDCVASVMLLAYPLSTADGLPDCDSSAFAGSDVTDAMNQFQDVQTALTACGRATLDVIEFMKPESLDDRVDNACPLRM